MLYTDNTQSFHDNKSLYKIKTVGRALKPKTLPIQKHQT